MRQGLDPGTNLLIDGTGLDPAPQPAAKEEPDRVPDNRAYGAGQDDGRKPENATLRQRAR